MKILLIEDYSIVRSGVISILGNLAREISIDESKDFDEALIRISKKRYDLVITDTHLSNGNNLQIVRLMRLKQADIKILIFSGSDERVYARHFLRAGADGYLMKNSSSQEIIDAVCCIMNNETYVSANVKWQLLQNLKHGERAANPLDILSDREVEVMQRLIRGESIGEIARIMNLHISTISTYKTRVFQKFQVNNVIDLAERNKMLG